LIDKNKQGNDMIKTQLSDTTSIKDQKVSHISSNTALAQDTVDNVMESLKSVPPLRTQEVALTPFHLALPVNDLDSIYHFYINQLAGKVGRSTLQWLDLSLFGHQLSFHLYPQHQSLVEQGQPVNGDHIPVPHFGVVLSQTTWQALASRVIQQNLSFTLAPRIRFRNTLGEQGTFFLRDPQGYLLEFKFFVKLSSLFAHDIQGDSYE
jgi:uncharacterized protein